MANKPLRRGYPAVVGRSNHNETTITVLHYCFCKSNDPLVNAADGVRDGSQSESNTAGFKCPIQAVQER
jgi:hypothetical protein